MTSVDPQLPLFLGLMSGTSADGIDAALVQFPQSGGCRFVHGYTHAWDGATRDALIALGQGGEPASMDALALGALLACRRTRGAGLPQWMRLGWPALAAIFLAIEWLVPAPADPMLEWARWALLQILPLVPLVAVVAACSAGLV